VRVLSRLLILIIFCSFATQWVYAKDVLRVNIIGLSGDVLKNTQDRLMIEQKLYGNELTAADVQAFYQHAPSAIRNAIEPYGFFKATIHPTLTRQGSTWITNFYIDPGQQLKITGIHISIVGPGKDNPEIQKFIHAFPLKAGDPFLAQQYENAKTALFQVVNNQGYLKALLTKKEILINKAKYTAHITLAMDTGPRYYFGSVSFSKSPFATRFLERFLSYHPGEPFSNQKVMKLQQDLTSSRYFREVAVTPQLEQTEIFKIPTHIQLDPYKAKQYKFGAGYGTFTGPRVLVGADWRHIGEYGHHFTTLAKYSPVLKGLAAKYFIPGANPLTDQYTIGANIQQFIPQNGNSFSESINGAYVKMLGEWQHSISLNLLNERYTFNNQPRRNSHELYPAYNISHIVADNIVDPHSGHMINFTIQGSSEKLFSTTSFIQSEIKAKYIMSPTTSSRVILRGDLGYTAVNDINQLPLTLQYLAGGPGSIRGYNYGSIGPGRYLEIASIEYQHQIIENVYAAIFYDMGTATNKFGTGLKRGDGFGFVYVSPIGPIQVYVARAESKSWKPKKILFNIGPEF
jgi:translocation and assembly module TamA